MENEKEEKEKMTTDDDLLTCWLTSTCLLPQSVGDRANEVGAPLPVQWVHGEVHRAPDLPERLEQGAEPARLAIHHDVDERLPRHPSVLKI